MRDGPNMIHTVFRAKSLMLLIQLNAEAKITESGENVTNTTEPVKRSGVSVSGGEQSSASSAVFLNRHSINRGDAEDILEPSICQMTCVPVLFPRW